MAGLCWLLLGTAGVAATAEGEQNWGHWRGPEANGAAPKGANPPVEWSETRNVAWKLPLPGRGHSSPIVWGDRVFLTSAIPIGEPLDLEREHPPGAHDNVPASQKHGFVVVAIERKSGEVAWSRTMRQDIPHDGYHYTGSLASHSPVTDGKRLFAFFGSYGLYALDLEGKLLWQKDFGRMKSKHGHGEGSSPFLYRDTLIVNWDHEGQSFLVALDASTGRERWRATRDEVTSWASPIVVEHAGPVLQQKRSRAQVIVSGTARIRGYDLESGEIIWECGGLSANIVASPVAGKDLGGKAMVWAASSYEKRAMVAIRLQGARGDITGSENVAWTRRRGTPYVPSPLLYRDSLYFLRHYQGILTRVVAESGEERQGPFRLNGIGNVYSSPVAASDRVYITDRQGRTLVITHEDEPKILSLNHLDDVFSASAAISGSDLFLRGDNSLYRLTDLEVEADPVPKSSGPE